MKTKQKAAPSADARAAPAAQRNIEKQDRQSVAASQASATAPKVEYSLSGGMIERLAKIKASLAFTSYQSGLLYLLGSNASGNAQLHQSGMPKPMGLASDERGGMVLTAGAQVMRFANVLEPDQRI